MDRPARLSGVQFISYAQLVTDVTAWASRLPQSFRSVVGLPRSGLTVAQILASEMHVPAVQIHAPPFRQNTGRKLRHCGGPFLVVDDTVSFGTAMQEARRQMPGLPCRFGAVYVRENARSRVDFWFATHAEPNWLVVTQWNIWSHQDSHWIVVEHEALFDGSTTLHRLHVPFAGIISRHRPVSAIKSWLRLSNSTDCCAKSGDTLSELYETFPDAALLVVRQESDALEVAKTTGRPVLSTECWRCHNSGWE